MRDKVKAYVFKFAARVAVGSAMRFLERNVRRRLVGMTDTDPALWALIADPTALLPTDRPAPSSSSSMAPSAAPSVLMAR